MDITQALDKIKSHWGELDHAIKEDNEAVWIAVSDISELYEVDEEYIGMKGDGSLVWAYASGCSCWCDDYDFELIKDIKVFPFKHDDMSKGWEKAIIEFANNIPQSSTAVSVNGLTN